ncbi:hypothetical protein [Burkholderia pseudomallei]|uniref:hypothetical protein n=1 Tax=Burkholderia pseudomallei TaxID=28450 RepID=UPI000AB31AB0|nr:hypothetical protein [Burkholderia pseudomallei]
MTFGFNVGIRDGKTTQRLARVRGSRVLPLAACRLPLAACRLPLAASIEHRARRASAAHIASRAYATLR